MSCTRLQWTEWVAVCHSCDNKHWVTRFLEHAVHTTQNDLAPLICFSQFEIHIHKINKSGMYLLGNKVTIHTVSMERPTWAHSVWISVISGRFVVRHRFVFIIDEIMSLLMTLNFFFFYILKHIFLDQINRNVCSINSFYLSDVYRDINTVWNSLALHVIILTISYV